MLGCFRPDFSILTTDENEKYKAVHCSVCKAIKREYNLASTMFLSYDLDFINLTINSFENCNTLTSTCTINPFKKIHIYDYDFTKFADLTLILIYVSLLDKKIDNESGFTSRIVEILVGKQIIKARNKFKLPLEEFVKNALSSHDEINEIAILYSSLIVNHLQVKEDLRPFLVEMIKIMYYFDSFKDYFEDIKHKKFNVFSNIPPNEIPDFAKESIVTSINTLMLFLENNPLNQKTLEYGLLSKYNKIKSNFIKKLRRKM